MSESTAAADPGAGPRLEVFATVGTDYHRFDRMVGWIDRWLGERAGGEVDCFVQHGSSSPPEHAGSAELLPYDEVRGRCERADVIVCQGGPGSVILANDCGLRPIVVPRTAELGEHVDDHQVAFARRLAEDGRIEIAEREDELRQKLDRALADRGWLAVEPEAPGAVAATVERFAAIVDPLIAGG